MGRSAVRHAHPSLRTGPREIFDAQSGLIVTGDGLVDNNDLNAVAAAIGQATPPGMTPLNADVNGDGSVTAFDQTLATRAKGRKLGPGLPLG